MHCTAKKTELQDKKAALGSLGLVVGAIGTAALYDFGLKMSVVIFFATFFSAWKIKMAFQNPNIKKQT